MKQMKPTTYLITIFAVLSLIIVGIVVLFYNINTDSQPSDVTQNEQIDPTSGEELLSPENKAPENYSTNPDAPIFLGFSELYNAGMSQTEVEAIKGALNDFASKQISDGKTKIDQVSLNVDDISQSVNRGTGESIYTLPLVFNQETNYTLKVSSDSLLAIKVDLYQANDKNAIFSVTKSIEEDDE